MSSHVGTIIIGGFPPEKEVVAEELQGQYLSSITYSNFPFEQGKLWCMPILSYLSSLLYLMLANILCTYVYDLYENVAKLILPLLPFVI
jgi:hypothetical protein